MRSESETIGCAISKWLGGIRGLRMQRDLVSAAQNKHSIMI